jgi:hypothetical protein
MDKLSSKLSQIRLEYKRVGYEVECDQVKVKSIFVNGATWRK